MAVKRKRYRKDHFENNPQQKGVPDFNFNFRVNVDGQPQVAEMAATLGAMVKRREQEAGLNMFHSPIPPEWLHLTGWYGSIKDFELEEVLQAAKILQTELAGFPSIEAQLSTWWQADRRAAPILDVTPKEPFQRIYAMVRSVMQDVVGVNRIPEPKEPHDPHVATIYATTYERTEAAENVVNSIHVEPVTFTVASIDLVRQYWDNQDHPNHYEWEVIKEIPIGAQ